MLHTRLIEKFWDFFKSASLFFVTIKHHQITLCIRQNLYFLLHTRLIEKFWDFFKSASLFFVTIKHHQITLCIHQNLYFLLHSRLMEKKQNANSTLCSQAVSHPSTNRAQCCLTSVIGRELYKTSPNYLVYSSELKLFAT